MAKIFNVTFEASRHLVTGDKVGVRLLDARTHVYVIVGKCDETEDHVSYVVQSGGKIGVLRFELSGSIHYSILLPVTHEPVLRASLN